MSDLLEEYRELIAERDNVINQLTDCHWVTEYYLYLREVRKAIINIRIKIIQHKLV